MALLRQYSVLIVYSLYIYSSWAQPLNAADEAALADLINTYNIPTACTEPSWDLADSPNATVICGWGRLSCVEYNGTYYISSMDLSSCGLGPAIPAPLGSLLELSILNLAANSFSDPVPAFIGDLQNLTELNLAENSLSGPFPEAITDLHKLSTLLLAHNSFSGGLPPLSNLTQLDTLDLSFNTFEGDISSLVDLPVLRVVKLGNNRFNGTLEHLNNGNTVLQEIQAENNLFTGGLFPWSSAALTKVSLANNHLSGDVSILANFTGLLSFDVSNNMFAGTVPRMIGINGIHTLVMSNNSLEGPLPANLSTNMKVLNLASNLFTGAIPGRYDMMVFTQLDLSDNLLTCLEGYLTVSPGACNLNNNPFCRPWSPSEYCGLTASTAPSCFPSVTICKPSETLDANCTAPRPSLLAECINGVYQFPVELLSFTGDVNITGPLLFSTDRGVAITGNIVLGGQYDANGTLISEASIIFAKGSGKLSVIGNLTFNNGSGLTIELDTVTDIQKLRVSGQINATATSPLSPILINATGLTSVYQGRLITTTGGIYGQFDASVAVSAAVSDNLVVAGSYCSQYSASVEPNDVIVQYTISSSPIVCALPPRVAPAPLPDRALDVGALVGSLFTAIILIFVLVAALILLDSDVQEFCLPFQDT